MKLRFFSIQLNQIKEKINQIEDEYGHIVVRDHKIKIKDFLIYLDLKFDTYEKDIYKKIEYGLNLDKNMISHLLPIFMRHEVKMPSLDIKRLLENKQEIVILIKLYHEIVKINAITCKEDLINVFNTLSKNETLSIFNQKTKLVKQVLSSRVKEYDLSQSYTRVKDGSSKSNLDEDLDTLISPYERKFKLNEILSHKEVDATSPRRKI